MKTVILAGGYGTRISEESGTKPKPLVEIGEKPILWHIMKIYSTYGVNDFVICLGYKGYMIKEFFANYFVRSTDITFNLRAGEMIAHSNSIEPWSVTLIDTGENSMTGGRLRRVRDFIGDETFFFTYGDCVTDVDMDELLAFHRQQGALATLTAVQPPGRFGTLVLEPDQTLISAFMEKPRGDGAWINGGFFVLEPEAIDYIEGDETSWEREPLERLAQDDRLAAFKHRGYWQNMDTLRDKTILDEQWGSGRPPWKTW
jgi:glucose-1-phosphate cytidylyltransferase